jgi:hypothetical protein
VTVYRCFAWNARADDDEPDGPLWFPRKFQGEGRHDNPDVYGCLYLADRPVSAVIEQLARFRTQRLTASFLRRRGLPLALATLTLDPRAEIIDFNEPKVLERERLRPSLVATRDRTTTQPQALTLFRRQPRLAALRWWSTYESQWMHLTLFDRAAKRLRLDTVRALTLEDTSVQDAAEFFAMRRS